MKLHYVITGANRGIGLELTRQAFEAGNEISAVVRDPAKAGKLEELARESGGRLRVLKADVTSDAEVAALARELERIGPIDVLINNAGAIFDRDENFPTLPLSKVQRSFEVNSIGPMRVTQALLPLLERAKAPKAVHITSMMGSIADNGSGGYYGYRMSKAALNMFMKCFAIEFPSITSFVIHPGWVRTDMGGEQAPVESSHSARGILSVIGRAEKSESGRFFDYEGGELPW